MTSRHSKIAAGLCLLLCGCASAPGQRQTLAQVFARVQTSVVTIVTKGRDVDLEQDRGLTSVGGIGSGVLISREGKVLTAAHVVQSADRVVVRFADGTIRGAEVVGSDTLNDVALLQLVQPPPAGAHVAPLANSDNAAVGEPVFVVGAPHGISHTLTNGILSARRQPARTIRSVYDTELFQTDAAINQGNSGGPMFNMNGDVIGIVSHIMSTSGGDEGLGFAVTINVARALLLDAPTFWSGVESIQIAGNLARLLNLPDGRSGVLVQRVAKRSPAARAGIRGGTVAATIDGEKFIAGGDIILEVAGVRAGNDDSYEQFRELIRTAKDGREIDVLLLRGGEQRTVTVTIDR